MLKNARLSSRCLISPLVDHFTVYSTCLIPGFIFFYDLLHVAPYSFIHSPLSPSSSVPSCYRTVTPTFLLTCMPSCPEIPTPTSATWIMLTSLAPSPVINEVMIHKL